MNAHSGYPALGEMMGPYRIGRQLGVGGMGVVFEALDTVLNRQVALKVITTQLVDDPDFRARFTREAQAQASLDSPHVVHVYAHGEEDGRLYIASQLIPDGDLAAMLQTYGAPPVWRALDLIAQVASGLADAHEAGLVHRDIKPPNVLLRRRPEAITAYLGDFGIARHVDAELTLINSGTLGTPTYMAPELHTGGVAAPSTDIYSLGCLLWATLSGRAPYGGTSDYEIVSAHLEEPIPQLAGEGAQVDGVNRILRTAMAKKPQERYTTAAAMRDDLQATRALGGAPVAARGRGRIALVVAAVLVVIAAGVGGAFALTRDNDGKPGPIADSSESPTPEDSASASGSTSVSPEVTPTPSNGDEAAAVASLTAALEDQGLVQGEQAACAARSWIEAAGLQEMIDAGFFDDDLNFVNLDQSQMTPEMQSAVLTAVSSCLAVAS